jgi:hypothetical protein
MICAVKAASGNCPAWIGTDVVCVDTNVEPSGWEMMQGGVGIAWVAKAWGT